MEAKVKCICKDCKKKFITESGEVRFLLSKGLEIYRRCPECRKANKNKKVVKED